MNVGESDKALIKALRTHLDGGSLFDALRRLRDEPLLISPWLPSQEWRTLMNSNGQSALPVFTHEQALHAASERLGWLAPDGSAPSITTDLASAAEFISQNGLLFLIFDLGEEHSVEVAAQDLDAFWNSPASTAELSPTRAAADASRPERQRKTSSTDNFPGTTPRLVQTAPRQTSPDAGMDIAALRAEAERESAVEVKEQASRPPDATFGSSSGSVTLHPMNEMPSDALLDALSNVARQYPEIEWAAIAMAARGPTQAKPTVALRVDASYRARVGELTQALRTSGDEQGATLDVLLLDDPKLMRQVRSEALLFFPWRRRS